MSFPHHINAASPEIPVNDSGLPASIKSRWEGSFWGPRQCIEMSFDRQGKLRRIDLISQSAFGRLLSFLGFNKNSRKHFTPLTYNSITAAKWESARKRLSPQSCSELLSESMHNIFKKTPAEIQAIVNQLAALRFSKSPALNKELPLAPLADLLQAQTVSTEFAKGTVLRSETEDFLNQLDQARQQRFADLLKAPLAERTAMDNVLEIDKTLTHGLEQALCTPEHDFSDGTSKSPAVFGILQSCATIYHDLENPRGTEEEFEKILNLSLEELGHTIDSDPELAHLKKHHECACLFTKAAVAYTHTLQAELENSRPPNFPTFKGLYSQIWQTVDEPLETEQLLHNKSRNAGYAVHQKLAKISAAKEAMARIAQLDTAEQHQLAATAERNRLLMAAGRALPADKTEPKPNLAQALKDKPLFDLADLMAFLEKHYPEETKLISFCRKQLIDKLDQQKAFAKAILEDIDPSTDHENAFRDFLMCAPPKENSSQPSKPSKDWQKLSWADRDLLQEKLTDGSGLTSAKLQEKAAGLLSIMQNWLLEKLTSMQLSKESMQQMQLRAEIEAKLAQFSFKGQSMIDNIHKELCLEDLKAHIHEQANLFQKAYETQKQNLETIFQSNQNQIDKLTKDRVFSSLAALRLKGQTEIKDLEKLTHPANFTKINKKDIIDAYMSANQKVVEFHEALLQKLQEIIPAK